MRRSFIPVCALVACAALWSLMLRLNAELFERHRALLMRLFAEMSRLSSRTAIPIAEVIAAALLAAVALAMLISLIASLVRRSPAPLVRLTAGVLCAALSAAALLSVLWPVHADMHPRAQSAYSRAYDITALEELILALDERARGDEAHLNLSGPTMRLQRTPKQLTQLAADAYTSAGLVEYAVAPKLSRWPRWMTAIHAAGIFIPFTGEALINPDDMDSALPFTMLHELAHSLGALREDEANLAALYAGLNSGDAELRWCSLITALRYSLNTLRALDTSRFERLLSDISPAAQRELYAQGAFSKPAERTSAYTGTHASGSALMASALMDEQTFGRVAKAGDYDGVVYLLLNGGNAALDMIRGR